MFTVKIRKDTFGISGMDFLEKKGFKPDTEYVAVSTIGQKLLIADPNSGEMVELFPRNCIYIK